MVKVEEIFWEASENTDKYHRSAYLLWLKNDNVREEKTQARNSHKNFPST
jgi:hypothetical protein